MSDNLKQTAWLKSVLHTVARVDENSVNFIRDQHVKIGFLKQGSASSAIWAPGKRIFLNPKYFSLDTEPSDPRLHSILVHEVCHLKQGFWMALSIYGELEAWQLGFNVYRELTGLSYHPNLIELMSLPLGMDRAILRRAQVLMRVYAGQGYRADLLPLFPLPGEINYWLRRR
jgi:hypothetical protein